MPPTVSPRKDVWETSAEIPYWWRRSDASSVWYFCSRFSDVISRENHWWRRKMSFVFSDYQTPSHYCFFPYTAWFKTFVPYWDPGSFIKDNAGKFQCWSWKGFTVQHSLQINCNHQVGDLSIFGLTKATMLSALRVCQVPSLRLWFIWKRNSHD